jgi:VanZ family protein
MKLHYRNVWLTLGWAWLFIIIILSLITIPSAVNVPIPYVDKIEHTVSYFVLMFLFGQCYTKLNTRTIYAVIFISIGIILEFLQGLTTTRQFEYADMIANSSGVVLGLILSDSYLQNIIRYIDNKLSKIINY